jgi:hypothetical protein
MLLAALLASFATACWVRKDEVQIRPNSTSSAASEHNFPKCKLPRYHTAIPIMILAFTGSSQAGLQRECGQSFKLEDPIREGPVRLDVAGLEKGNNVTSSQIPLFREFVVLELRFVCNLLWTR